MSKIKVLLAKFISLFDENDGIWFILCFTEGSFFLIGIFVLILITYVTYMLPLTIMICIVILVARYGFPKIHKWAIKTLERNEKENELRR